MEDRLISRRWFVGGEREGGEDWREGGREGERRVLVEERRAEEVQDNGWKGTDGDEIELRVVIDGRERYCRGEERNEVKRDGLKEERGSRARSASSCSTIKSGSFPASIT